ncbi:hypothetical protein SNOG_16007 [Parastagonospora nodorum SN15]|uniref:Rho-GAP domain-containing protein n=1 Tax=Phaeosphaeria nodorum (strain SN15 / ATCC MYA-4574 / FGSC 10173) TaxID=321614 RepID=Q0TWT6_PHANO|nr:hypothetical protein SNOG_16007 [Parastagonospora nodorum SN15]EAT76586.2 hypothetical protein SNOG_16007 [Parastagonospora nodorum SN15]
MPNPGMQNHAHTPRVRNGDLQPTALQTPEPASAKRDLTSWWRQFSKRPARKEDEKEAQPGIFGVPLIQSIPYANVAISLFNEHGESYIYGYVPIVVAKCGVYLKEKGPLLDSTDVEGIFRLAGSEKRIKELKTAFDTPPRYGKGLDWTGYTVHDAANILRRYFNNLPEPIIPLGNYDPFRQPLRGHQAEAVGYIEGQSPSTGGFDPDAAVRIYQHLIKGLPSLNRQLLLYILDLLAVFAAKSDVNKMTTHNLAAIFQPGILSHPQHDMSPADYRLSQDVLIFLIDNQDHFLIVATKPVEEVPETAPQRALTMPPTRIEMPPAAPMTTLPQGKPALVTPVLDQIPGAFPLPSPGIIPPSEDVTPSATAQVVSDLLPAVPSATGQRSPHLTPTRERAEFMEGPVDSGPPADMTPATRTFTQILAKAGASPSSDAREGRKPNKLQKKRIPSSAISSAHSSTHSLTGGDIGVGMVHIPPSQHSPLHPPQLPFAPGYSHSSGSKDALSSHNNDAVSSRNSGTTLKPSMSPSGSYRSHSTATEYSETADPTEEIKEEKRSFWKGHKRGESRATPTASQTDLHGSVPGGDKSMSSFGSSSGWGASGSRRSLQYDSHQNSDLSTAYGSPPDSDKPEKKGSAFDWFHKMRQDHKEPSSLHRITYGRSKTVPMVEDGQWRVRGL